MRNIGKGLILVVALGGPVAATASDAFAAAHDDAPYAASERGNWSAPSAVTERGPVVATASDAFAAAHDDAGISPRLVDAAEAAAYASAPGYALAPNPHDDANIGVREEAAAATAIAAPSSKPGEPTVARTGTAAHACACVM